MTTSPDPGRFPADQTAFPGPYHKENILPLGDWHLMANGRIYTLTIINVSGGDVTATLSSGDVVKARWDAVSGKFDFYRVLPHITQKFTGYLLHYDAHDFKWRMAGVFGDVKEVDPQSAWYATMPKAPTP